MNTVRVLIVDDSRFMQQALRKLLASEPRIEVVGFAADGFEAIEKRKELNPDVITLDVMMPRLDGIETVRQLMSNAPVPIVMVSSYTAVGARYTVEALSLGAIDHVLKPGHSVSLDLELIAEELISKILMASRIRPIRNAPLTKKPVRKEVVDLEKLKKKPGPLPEVPLRKKNWKVDRPHLITIGASTGGPALLRYLFSRLPADYPIPIAAVQHITPSFHSELLRIFNRVTPLSVVSPHEGEKPQPGKIYLASPRAHLTINQNYRFRLIDSEPVDGHVPSATRLIESAARAYGSLALGMILTGMGTDGATGMRALAERGGQVYILEEASCVVFGMPKAVLDKGVPAEALSQVGLAEVLLNAAGYQTSEITVADRSG